MTHAPLPRALLALTVILTLALGACGGSKSSSAGGEGDAPAAAGNQKKVLNLVRGSAHKNLDPVKQFDQASADIVSNLYDTVLSYHYLKRPYQLVPSLAENMPTASEDGLTYTFKLRKDVKFVDDECFPGGKGRTLNADDVIYSIKRFADANLNAQSYMLMAGFVEGMDAFREETKKAGKDADYGTLEISGLQKVDDFTFTMKLTQPNPLALLPLAASQLSIVPREAVEHYKADFERKPVGSGPFKVQKLSRRGVIILERNPGYHGVYPSEGDPGDKEAGLLASAGQKLPLVDEVHLPLIEEAQPRMLKFKRGQIDLLGFDKNNFRQMAFKDDKGFHLKPEWADKFEILSGESLSTEYFVYNMDDPLVGKNKALRQAIAYALDIPGFIKDMRNGRGVKMHTLVPLPIAGSERELKDLQRYDRDLAKAKEKLVEAGFPGGKGLPPLTVEYRNSSTDTRQEFEYHRAKLAEVGITLKANFQTFSAFLQRVDSGNFQMTISGWAADYPDAENFYQLTYGPNKRPGPNASGYQNPEYDKLYERSRFMPNGPERYAIFKQMADILYEDVPVFVTWTYIPVSMRQKWVKNRKLNSMITGHRFIDIDVAAKTKGVQ